MQYKDNVVGELSLAPGAPLWVVQLSGAVADVERKQFISQLERLLEQVREAGRQAAIKRAMELVCEYDLKPSDVFERSPKRSSRIGVARSNKSKRSEQSAT